MNLEPSNRLSRLHGRVLSLTDTLIELAQDGELLSVQAPEVSAWSIGQQLDHLLHADRSILDRWDRVERGQAPSSTGGLKLPGWICLTLGFIPRGKGKAPEPTRPQGVADGELAEGFLDLRRRMVTIGEDLAIHETASWKARHPYFGALSPVQWLRFIEIHRRHHLAIIRDIRRAQ